MKYELKRVCVFCGSLSGYHAEYVQAADDFGRLLVQEKIGLVYGGGNIGMMGALADAVIAAGGEAIGIIPRSLMGLEVAGRPLDHPCLTRLEVVESMHQRKARMAELADAFIALPGGFGTFEELCEMLTWSQLGFHGKPCALLNVRGYYDPLLALFDTAVREGFLSQANRLLILTDTDGQSLLERLHAFHYEKTNKWLLSPESL